MQPFRKRKVFLHTGHIGDIIAFLPTFQKLEGTTLLVQDGEYMAPMKGFKFNSMKPLLESQGIEATMDSTGLCVDVDVSGWRLCYDDNVSLLDAQARFLKVVPRKTGHMEITEPWIKVDENPDGKGRVVINRSLRYHNDQFPWQRIVDKYRDRAVFIGTDEEHADFCFKFGSIDRYKTENCLEVARMINACDLFVGNQSSSFWIAAALRKPLIQEVFLPAPNSIVKYESAVYLFDDKIRL